MIGVGNPWRRDDGAGPAVAAALGGVSTDDPSRLLELWQGAQHVVVVDAAASGAPAGTIHRFDAARPLPAHAGTSTHAFGIADAVELARALARLPPQLTVYAIEGEQFGPGEGLSAPVAAATRTLIRELRARERRGGIPAAPARRAVRSVRRPSA